MRPLYLRLYYGHEKNDGYAWWLCDSLLGLVECGWLCTLSGVTAPSPISPPSVKVRPAKKGSRPVMAATCHNPRIKEHQARSQDEMDKSTSESASPLGNTKLRLKAGRYSSQKDNFLKWKWTKPESATVRSGMRKKHNEGTPHWGASPSLPLMSSRSFYSIWRWDFCITGEF